MLKNLVMLDHKDEKLFFSLSGYMSLPSAFCTARTIQARQVSSSANRFSLFLYKTLGGKKQKYERYAEKVEVGTFKDKNCL